jgi:hypothetical protein
VRQNVYASPAPSSEALLAAVTCSVEALNPPPAPSPNSGGDATSAISNGTPAPGTATAAAAISNGIRATETATPAAAITNGIPVTGTLTTGAMTVGNGGGVPFEPSPDVAEPAMVPLATVAGSASNAPSNAASGNVVAEGGSALGMAEVAEGPSAGNTQGAANGSADRGGLDPPDGDDASEPAPTVKKLKGLEGAVNADAGGPNPNNEEGTVDAEAAGRNAEMNGKAEAAGSNAQMNGNVSGVTNGSGPGVDEPMTAPAQPCGSTVVQESDCGRPASVCCLCLGILQSMEGQIRPAPEAVIRAVPVTDAAGGRWHSLPSGTPAALAEACR